MKFAAAFYHFNIWQNNKKMKNCVLNLHAEELSSAAPVGVLGTNGTNPRPPNIGLMNLSSNFLQK